MVCNQNIIEKLESDFSVSKIDFNIRAVKNIRREDELECGVFEFRGISDDIYSIYDALAKVAKYKNNLRAPKEYSRGLYEFYYHDAIRPIEFYKNIVNEYPSVKVIGYCFNGWQIYTLFSETGYKVFTEFVFCGYINKIVDTPWWYNERPSIRGLSNPLASQWSAIDFVIRNGKDYYQLMKKNDDTSIRELKLVSHEEKKLKDYQLEWIIKKVGEHYVLKKYIGNSENVFVPGRINGRGVILGSNLFTTGKYFYSFDMSINKKVKNILVGDGVVEIENGAFAGCCYLENIAFPKKITKIGNDILYGCHLLDEEITIGNNLVLASRKSNANEMIVSGKFKTVKKGAFQHIGKIKKLVFDEGIKKIEDLPDSVEIIEIPSTVKYIEDLYFPHTGLKCVKLSNGITEISGNCFRYCQDLEQVVIPESVKEISDYAFWNNKKLNKTSEFFIPGVKGVIIPPTVKKMGICDFGPKITVFDSLECWKPSKYFCGTFPHNSVLVTVCSEINREIKYRVWIGYEDETERTKEILTRCWDCNAEIKAEIYDELYSKYKNKVNKHLYVIYRLRYPYKLDEKHQKKLANYFNRYKSDIYKTLDELGDVAHLAVYSELLEKTYR